jgi:uncharacterized protein
MDQQGRSPAFRNARCIAGCIVLIWLLNPTGPVMAQSQRTLAGMQAYNSGDVATAYRLLRQEADTGDSDAQVNLGYLYARGQGVVPDQGEAFRLYSLSAKQGNGEGMNALGYKYQFATGVTKDINLAIHWYCEVVLAGNPRGMNNLAALLSSGKDLPCDLAEARNLWQQAAELGHMNAMFNLGSSYLQEPERDPAAALQWMQQAATRGHPQAQAWLRARGYRGPLPSPVNASALMIPNVGGRAGRSTVCSAPTS